MQRGAYVVGVAGGSGSGKTTLVRALRERMPDGMVSLVSQDDYYLPIEQQAIDPQGKVNFDLPTAIDLDGLTNDLVGLMAGEPIQRQEYTFNQRGRETRWVEVAPAPVVVVEGLFILQHAPLRELFDLRVYVEADEEIQLQRRLARDQRERGYGREQVMYQWEHHVLPAQRAHLAPYRHLCDLHVVNASSFDRALHVLAHHLERVAVPHSEPQLQPL